MSWRHSMMIWATKVISAPWSCWGLVSTGPPCTEKPRTTSATVSGARWAMHQRSTPLPVICLPAVLLKSWQSTSRRLRLLAMGEKIFLFSQMFSRSSPRPYRRATRRQGQWPRCWFTSGSSDTGYPRKSTVTRVGTLSLSWWNPCVSSMASRRPGPLHTTPVATRSASDSIACCIICFEPCPRNRSLSGHSTSRSLCRRITIRFTLPPARVPGEIKRSRDLRGGRWSWTLTFAQKRSWVGRWSWAEQVGRLLLRVVQVVHQQRCNGHCLSDSVQHSGWKSNCTVHKSLGNGEGTPP